MRYQVSYIPRQLSGEKNVDDVTAAVIHVNATTEREAAERMFVFANRGAPIISDVVVVKLLHDNAPSMSLGDIALVEQLDGTDREVVTFRCESTGWSQAVRKSAVTTA